ncbi:MAG TPA: hypothetical protein VF747_10015 [Blastocatellia bacterium]
MPLSIIAPINSVGGSLACITHNGSPVVCSTETIKGVQYALFQAVAGAYRAS